MFYLKIPVKLVFFESQNFPSDLTFWFVGVPWQHDCEQ